MLRMVRSLRTEDMQGLGTSDYMGSAHWRSVGDDQTDPDDSYPFVSIPFSFFCCRSVLPMYTDP